MGGQQRASHVSCLKCEFFDDNKCTWFKYFKDEEPKAIPDKIIDQGCKLYCDHPLTLEIMSKFK